MKMKLFSIRTSILLLWVLVIPCIAQTDIDKKITEQESIISEQEKETNLPTFIRSVHIENLSNLYKSLISLLDQKINMLTETDPQRKEYEQKRTEAKKYLNILLMNLKSGNTEGKTSNENVGTKSSDKGDSTKKSDDDNESYTKSNKKDNTYVSTSVTVQPVAAPQINSDVTVQPVIASQINSQNNTFTDAPPVLEDDAQLLAKGILFDIARGRTVVSRISDRYPRLFFFTIASKVTTGQEVNSISNLEPIRFLVETARTDKQIGASSSTSASTSAIDKPGFPWLLGFAIENGFVERSVHDTVLTLSTSPSVFFSIKEKDATKAYRDAGFFNKVGISASFNINSENPLLANATRSQLREYSVRFRFYGDRSSRSPELETIWEEKLVPVVQSFLVPLNQANIILDDLDLSDEREVTEANLTALVQARVNSAEFKALKEEDQIRDLTNRILNFLKTAVAEKTVVSNTSVADKIVISEPVKTRIKDEIISALLVAQQNQKRVAKEIQKRLDDFFKGPLGTVAYINHRDPLGNYSEFKLLFEHNGTFLKPLKFLANAGVSFYHKPDPTMNQKRARDFNVALSLEGKTSSPFTETEDFSQITYSFTGRYMRMFENRNMPDRKADLANFQFLVNFPFLRGLSLPLSVTYSNATELERKQGVRVNFGLKLDTDKLFEIIQFNRRFQQ